MFNITLAYGSESGNAKHLAQRFAEQCGERGLALERLVTLNEVLLDTLTADDTLLIVTSSFGDGEPTGNAETFYEQLLAAEKVLCRFAVFGLGDVSYPKFCGFSKDVDRLLREKGATAMASRVDADTNYQAFFQQWSDAVIAYCSGNATALQALNLQVKAYSENQSFPARVESVRRINTGDFPAYDIQISIAGSGMRYRAGDLLYVVPPANDNTLSRIAAFYGGLSDDKYAALGRKELRHLGKPLFRALAKLSKNSELKALTKISASQQLSEYCYGRDVADVLYDFFTPDALPVCDLLGQLSAQLPRAYSIASCGNAAPNTVRLCVREVVYRQNGTEYVGTASHYLAHCEPGSVVHVYVRDNAHFHLPKNDQVPMILIGAGVGIAPFMGFLQQARRGQIHLFFGDRYCEHDFLYHDVLNKHLSSGRLTSLHTAFSRDQTEKIYVQDRLREQGKHIWQQLEQGAEIYVCGSKTNFAKSLDNTLLEIAQTHGKLSNEQAQQWLFDLFSAGLYHKDLY